MSVRRFVRGTVPWDRLEALARELGERYDESPVRVEFLDAENWFSTPFVVNDEYFVKVVTPQNATVHALFTGMRNLGVFSSGTEGFFEQFEDAYAMAAYEYDATERMRESGLNVPEPVDVFEFDGFGVLVLEYLPEFTPLDDLPEADIAAYAPDLFAGLRRMHDHGVAHGDLRGENVLVSDGDLYFIDATNVREGREAAARAYDLACALAVLEPLVGASVAVDAAREHYDATDLLDAWEFLDFVNIRPDHDFDAGALKGEIEAAAG